MDYFFIFHTKINKHPTKKHNTIPLVNEQQKWYHLITFTCISLCNVRLSNISVSIKMQHSRFNKKMTTMLLELSQHDWNDKKKRNISGPPGHILLFHIILLFNWECCKVIERQINVMLVILPYWCYMAYFTCKINVEQEHFAAFLHLGHWQFMWMKI